MVTANPEVQDILNRVRSWSIDDRRRLVEEILKSLRSQPVASPAKKTLQDLRGLLRVEGVEPPDDAECRQILEEELIKKHL